MAISPHLNPTNICPIKLSRNFPTFRDFMLWNKKKRDPFCAFWGTRESGQNAVDDVGGEVMLAAGDEDLSASDFILAITDWLSTS
jgi:hypothetical protein